MQRWPVWKKAPLIAQFTAVVEIGVVEHDERVLAAHLELEPGEARGAFLRDVPAGVDAAGEADRSDVRRVEDRLADHRAAPHHQIEHALGQPARCRISASAQAQAGTRSAGLSTTVLP